MDKGLIFCDENNKRRNFDEIYLSPNVEPGESVFAVEFLHESACRVFEVRKCETVGKKKRTYL